MVVFDVRSLEIIVPIVWTITGVVLVLFAAHFTILLYHWYRFSVTPVRGGLLLVGYIVGSSLLALSLIGAATALTSSFTP